MTYECGAWHTCSCPVAVLDRDRVISRLSDDLQTLNQSVHDHIDTNDLQRRVIDRLLDGWRPQVGQPLSFQQRWFRPRGPIEELDPEFESMSDGEAAIIRAHQEAQK